MVQRSPPTPRPSEIPIETLRSTIRQKWEALSGHDRILFRFRTGVVDKDFYKIIHRSNRNYLMGIDTALTDLHNPKTRRHLERRFHAAMDLLLGRHLSQVLTEHIFDTLPQQDVARFGTASRSAHQVVRQYL